MSPVAFCFLSYARRPYDEQVLRHIVAFLERAGVRYWWDAHAEARGGSELDTEIAHAINAARVVLVLASSQSLSSRYCQAEIAWALQHDKPIVRIDIERYELPARMMPLLSAGVIDWDPDSPHANDAALASALAAKGLDAGAALAVGHGRDLVDDPNASLIRPGYLQLRGTSADTWREHVRRLNQAAALNPHNGYNQLSLALLWLHARDAPRSLAAARAALSQLAREPDAHYVEALALCIQCRADLRSHSDVESILRRLAAARALPGAGAHIDLLSALVIANYYLPRYMTPPAAPDTLLLRGLSSGGRFDPGENARVLDLEPVLDASFTPDARVLARYLEGTP
jgi:hypothetical protein